MLGRKKTDVENIALAAMGEEDSLVRTMSTDPLVTVCEEAIIDLTDPFRIFKLEAVVRNPITILAHFATRKGFHTRVVFVDGHEPNDTEKTVLDKLSGQVDEVNRRVSLSTKTYTFVLKREIWGRAGGEIVNGKDIKKLKVLSSTTLMPHVNADTGEIEYFDYTFASTQVKLKPEETVYFVRDDLEDTHLGLSAIKTVQTVVNARRNLIVDLQQASKRLWAPIGLFEIDTTGLKDLASKTARINAFKEEVKPGRSIVHNYKVNAKIIDMHPDINGIVRAIEKCDEDILGNWGVPKALLAREKTLSKATLEFSIRALYESTVSGIQLYFGTEYENQWYPQVLKSLKIDTKIYRVNHVWNPVTFVEAEMVKAVVVAYQAELITKPMALSVLGWDALG